MKRISKIPPPASFLNWKSKQERASCPPPWASVPKKIKIAVRDSLMKEQGHICCYCEKLVTPEEGHVEHFRPKKQYPALALDYSNLHFSCHGNMNTDMPRHCGHAKGDWFDENLLISPLEPDCEERFRYTANGRVLSRPRGDVSARSTIGKLNLDAPNLRAARRSAIDAVRKLQENQDSKHVDIARLLEKSADGHYMPFHSAIRYLFLKYPGANDSAGTGEQSAPGSRQSQRCRRR